VSGPLLEAVRGLLERTYRMECGLGELGPFVIGDAGYRALYGSGPAPASAGAEASGARTLVRETADGVRARIYLPDGLIERLERFPPQRGVGSHNVEAFAVFVEEIDHLLMIAERTRQQRPVSLFELELHANVSKHLVVARFLAASRGRLGPRERIWLRRALFGSARYAEEEPAVRSRYRDAARFAVRLLDALAALGGPARLALLRRFHVAGVAGKLELIGACGA
jgi:hypothetical protein